MKRNIYDKLSIWKASSKRKPLILQGARQVGKTYILKAFAQSAYQDYLYINFEENKQVHKFFTNDLSANRILNDLELFFGKKIQENSTLLIFDEIQECQNALNSLKYFQENQPNIHIIAAGSLLGVKLGQSRGFPVGKVNFLQLYPLNFFEFLDALNRQDLRHYLEAVTLATTISEGIHQELLSILNEYIFVGGMPGVINQYRENKTDYAATRTVQNELLKSYELDFAKYAKQFEAIKISRVWENIPSQLAKDNKKFIFSVIRQGARARDYEYSLQWLFDSGLAYKVANISNASFPLSAYATNEIFKIYLLDVGLLGAMCHLEPKSLIQGDELFTSFKGALLENYVLQEIKARHDQLVYYWTSEGIAEVDFLLEYGQKIYPLEVKAGISKQKKSLKIFGQKYQPETLARCTAMNLLKNQQIINYPLYLAALFPELQSSSTGKL
jgi:predicted AAA+ superfamily ATPase